MGEKIIADALDAALARHYEQHGNAEREKTGVVFMDGRWVAIQGGYTFDEIRDAVEYIKHRRLTKEFGKVLADLSPFAIKHGQVFIKDAFIDKAIASADYSMKVGVNHNFKGYVAGMPLSVEKHSTEREKVYAVVSKYLTGEATEYTDELVDELISLRLPANSNQPEGKPSTVEFKSDRFAIHENVQSVIDNAIANHKTNAQVDSNDKSHVVSLGDCIGNTATAWRLSDEMHVAILNVVRESDLFKSIAHSLDAQAASIADLTQVVHSTANAALRSKKPDIEKETLSAVLANTLHVVPINKVWDTAIQLAKAVKAAFNELEKEDVAAN